MKESLEKLRCDGFALAAKRLPPRTAIWVSHGKGSGRNMDVVSDRTKAYNSARFWYLAQLLRVRVQGEMGAISMPNAAKERRELILEMAALRQGYK